MLYNTTNSREITCTHEPESPGLIVQAAVTRTVRLRECPGRSSAIMQACYISVTAVCDIAQPMHDPPWPHRNLRRKKPLDAMLLLCFDQALPYALTAEPGQKGKLYASRHMAFLPSESKARTSSTLCYTVGVGGRVSASVISAKLVDLCVPSSLGFRVFCAHFNSTPSRVISLNWVFKVACFQVRLTEPPHPR